MNRRSFLQACGGVVAGVVGGLSAAERPIRRLLLRKPTCPGPSDRPLCGFMPPHPDLPLHCKAGTHYIAEDGRIYVVEPRHRWVVLPHNRHIAFDRMMHFPLGLIVSVDNLTGNAWLMVSSGPFPIPMKVTC